MPKYGWTLHWTTQKRLLSNALVKEVPHNVCALLHHNVQVIAEAFARRGLQSQQQTPVANVETLAGNAMTAKLLCASLITHEGVQTDLCK